MVNKRKELKFILQSEVDNISKGMDKVDLLSDDDLEDIFSTDRRDGVRSRFKDKLKLF